MKPLSRSEDQTEFWRQHVHMGVWLAVFLGALICGYVVFSDGDERIIGGALGAVVVSLGQLALPMGRVVRSGFGAVYLYTWAVSGIVVITWAAALDGGAGSPIVYALLVLLIHGVSSYPPAGQVLMLATIGGAWIWLHRLAGADALHTIVATGFLATLGYVGSLSAHNHWVAYFRERVRRREAQRLAVTDGLTGCLTHQAFHAALADAAATAAPDSPVGLVLFDVDDFKRLNDQSGHRQGDRFLAGFGAALRAELRDGDVVGRLGGDEFGALVRGPGRGKLDAVAERIRTGVSRLEGEVTVSAGFASTSSPMDADALFAAADRELYAAKAAGRDRVRGLEAQRPESAPSAGGFS